MRIDDGILLNSLPKVQPLRPAIDISIGDKLPATDSGALFRGIFEDSMQAYEEASAVSKDMTTQLLTGQLDDLSAFQVANQKSSLMFDLNLSMRTKVLEAYDEIMRMQV